MPYHDHDCDCDSCIELRADPVAAHQRELGRAFLAGCAVSSGFWILAALIFSWATA